MDRRRLPCETFVLYALPRVCFMTYSPVSNSCRNSAGGRQPSIRKAPFTRHHLCNRTWCSPVESPHDPVYMPLWSKTRGFGSPHHSAFSDFQTKRTRSISEPRRTTARL